MMQTCAPEILFYGGLALLALGLALTAFDLVTWMW